MSDKKRTTVTIGDVLQSTKKDTGEPMLTKDGLQQYSLQVWLPDDVKEVTLKKGDYINFRQLSDEDVEKMPDWKKPLAQIRAWVYVDK